MRSLASSIWQKSRRIFMEERGTLSIKTALELKAYPIQYYTGYCTGEAAYQLMQGILGNQIEYIRCGGRIEL